MSVDLTKVKNLIDSLTDNEDLRQELWVHYLSGRATSTFIKQLELIYLYHRVVEDFQRGLEECVTVPLSSAAEQAFQVLSPVEQQVVYLLVLGLSPDDVAKYKGISLVKVHQMIASIQASQVWKNLWRGYSRCRSRKRLQKKNAAGSPKKRLS